MKDRAEDWDKQQMKRAQGVHFYQRNLLDYLLSVDLLTIHLPECIRKHVPDPMYVAVEFHLPSHHLLFSSPECPNVINQTICK